jgi:hypothetical protein
MRRISQRRTIEMQLVQADHLQPASALIIEQLGPETNVTISDQELMVRFDTDRTDEQLPALLAKLLGKQIAVAQFREVVQDLEDAFISVTRDPDALKQPEPHPQPVASQS